MKLNNFISFKFCLNQKILFEYHLAKNIIKILFDTKKCQLNIVKYTIWYMKACEITQIQWDYCLKSKNSPKSDDMSNILLILFKAV
jgi:hypothetical protein